MRFAKGYGFSNLAQRQTVGIHAKQPRVVCTMLKLSDRVHMRIHCLFLHGTKALKRVTRPTIEPAHQQPRQHVLLCIRRVSVKMCQPLTRIPE